MKDSIITIDLQAVRGFPRERIFAVQLGQLELDDVTCEYDEIGDAFRIVVYGHVNASASLFVIDAVKRQRARECETAPQPPAENEEA